MTQFEDLYTHTVPYKKDVGQRCGMVVCSSVGQELPFRKFSDTPRHVVAGEFEIPANSYKATSPKR
jgi:hypothetical protein